MTAHRRGTDAGEVWSSFVFAPERWVTHVRSRARHYYPDLFRGAEPRVELVRAQARGYTFQYVVSIEARRTSRLVVVKHTNTSAPPPAGPVLGDPADRARKHETEWRALGLLYRGVSSDPGLAAIRPLEHLPQDGVIVMEWLSSMTLRDYMLRPGRRPQGRHGIAADEVLARAGRVIRRLHDLPPPAVGAEELPRDPLPARCDRLQALVGPDRLIDRLRDVAGTLDAHVGAEWMGLHHGDLAPRNLLVTPDGRVACIDMLARTRRPVAADLAYLRGALNVTLRPLGTRPWLPGARMTGRGERALVRGYLDPSDGPTRPDALTRGMDVHEVFALLARWASLVTSARTGPLAGPRVAWQLHLVRGRLREVVTALESWARQS